MADTKISALTALTAPAADDLVPLVDISDTTMAASGTTKRMKASYLGVVGGVFNVQAYGALPDNNATDAQPGIQAAVDAAAAAGGGIVYIPPSAGNFYIIRSTVSVTTPNISIVGAGNSRFSLSNWSSAVLMAFAGVGFDFYAPTGATENPTMGGMRNLLVHGNGLATRIVRVRSLSGGDFEHLTLYSVAGGGYALETGCIAALAGNGSPQHLVFRDINIYTSAATGNGVLLGGVTGGGANTSFNLFSEILVVLGSGACVGVDMSDSDNNVLENVRVYGSGSAVAMELRGSNTSAGMVCRSNRVHIATTLPINARGTTSYTYPSGDNGGGVGVNYIELDAENGTVYPTIETGAGVVFANRGARALQNVVYAATVTPDPYKGETVKVGTLTGDITIANPTVSTHVGKVMRLMFTQDATGGRVVSWGANFDPPEPINSLPNATSTRSFVWDDTKWRPVASTPDAAQFIDITTVPAAPAAGSALFSQSGELFTRGATDANAVPVMTPARVQASTPFNFVP